MNDKYKEFNTYVGFDFENETSVSFEFDISFEIFTEIPELIFLSKDKTWNYIDKDKWNKIN